MKRKPEVLLQDVFKALKPSLVILSTDGIAFDYQQIIKLNFFHKTKPITGITKKEAEDLWESYLAIRKFREERKAPTIKPCKGERLFPLEQGKYDKIARKIYYRNNQPTFGIRRVDKVIFGDPITTFSNYVKGKSYSAPVIIGRAIGIRPVRGLLGHVILNPTIDVDSENILKNWRINKYRSR